MPIKSIFTPVITPSESLNSVELSKMNKSIQKFERFKVMNPNDDLLEEITFPKI
jgi:hypothetical protein